MDIVPLGDCAALIRVAEELNDETANKVLAVQHRIESARVAGIIELASAYTTVAVFYDPAAIDVMDGSADQIFEKLASDIRAALAGRISTQRVKPRRVEIAVCYGEDFGPDLPEVARHAGLEVEAVTKLHCGASYRVSCIGFTPGFPYLSGLPPKIATPRRAVPRKEVPQGSVAIGGSQTGIYPMKSPGGWHIIGRTPLRLFEPNQNPPSLLCSGDQVRFRSISRDELLARSA
jgi:inhibitor of KinA